MTDPASSSSPQADLIAKWDYCGPCITAEWCSFYGGCLAERRPPVTDGPHALITRLKALEYQIRRSAENDQGWGHNQVLRVWADDLAALIRAGDAGRAEVIISQLQDALSVRHHQWVAATARVKELERAGDAGLIEKAQELEAAKARVQYAEERELENLQRALTAEARVAELEREVARLKAEMPTNWAGYPLTWGDEG